MSTAILLAVLGWLIAYVARARLDILQKKRELRLEQLIPVYQKLTTAAGAQGDVTELLEDCLLRLQLCGTERQCILLAQVITLLRQPYAPERSRCCGELIENIVVDLRRSVGLKAFNNYDLMYFKQDQKCEQSHRGDA